MQKHETPEFAEYARKHLRVDEEGRLFWTVSSGTARANAQAGSVNARYRRVKLMGRNFLAHRVVWLLTHGEWPVGLLDHENRDTFNNKPSNLRVFDRSSNAQNSKVRSDNSTGARGVKPAYGKFRADITHNGRRTYLGVFKTVEQAALAYMSAAKSIAHPLSAK